MFYGSNFLTPTLSPLGRGEGVVSIWCGYKDAPDAAGQNWRILTLPRSGSHLWLLPQCWTRLSAFAARHSAASARRRPAGWFDCKTRL